jgi:hypothetical protein
MDKTIKSVNSNESAAGDRSKLVGGVQDELTGLFGRVTIDIFDGVILLKFPT